MKVYAFAALLAAALIAPAAGQMSPAPSPAPSVTSSGSLLNAAKPTCKPGDAVVWVNPDTKMYYTKGMLSYGKMAGGKYMCQSAAMAAGDKLSGGGSAAAAPPAVTATGGVTTTNTIPSPVATMTSGP